MVCLPAAQLLKNFPEVAREPIGPHADMGQLAFLAAIITTLLVLGTVVLSQSRKKLPKALIPAIMVAELVTGILLGYTAHLGGEIRHTEIRESSMETPAPGY